MALFNKGKRQRKREQKVIAAAMAEGHEDLQAWEGQVSKTEGQRDPTRRFVGTSLRLLFGHNQGRLPGPRHPRPRN
jgi:hypothetical protein